MRALTGFPRLRNLIATAVFSALASGFGAVAAAADGPQPTARVKYGDLNVSTTEGATELYGRIRSAATHVCSSLTARWTSTRRLSGPIASGKR